jgi:hypothetical protein
VGNSEAFTVSMTAVRRLAGQARTFREHIEADLFESTRDYETIAAWRCAPYDPTPLIDVFPHIRLKQGIRLASYQYGEGDNGNGFAFALPEFETLPHPPAGLTFGWASDGSPVLAGRDVALPDWLDPRVERFVEGDGSPVSYFEASLFSRELRELGAIWHGCSWSEHEILTSSPLKALDELEWVESRPKELRPQVSEKSDGSNEVVFYSFTDLVQCQVIRHRDVFERGYSFTTTAEHVALGGPGKIF